MTGGNQLKLSVDHLRHAGRRRGRPRPPARRRRRRHVGRRQHPVVAHGRVRRRRRHAQAADDPGRRGAGAARDHGDRPALRPAQPLRPAADDRRAVTAAARDRRRRGHLRDRDRRGRPRDPAGHRAAARSRSSTRPAGHERLRGQALVTAAGQRRRPARAAGRHGVRPDRRGRCAARRRRCPTQDAAELAEAQADLRQMARDIAADDVSPTHLRRRLARKRPARKTGRAVEAPPPHEQQDGDPR